MMNLKIESKDWTPFTSDAAKYAFALLHMNGVDQKTVLGVTRKQYNDTGEATSWKNVIEHTLDTAEDVPQDIVDAAKVTLYQIYGDMIRNIPGQRPYPYGVPFDPLVEEY